MSDLIKREDVLEITKEMGALSTQERVKELPAVHSASDSENVIYKALEIFRRYADHYIQKGGDYYRGRGFAYATAADILEMMLEESKNE